MITDEAHEMGILAHVLVLHPMRLSAAELRREMLADQDDFAHTDTHDNAVRRLVAAGLLRHDGDSIIATRAAMHFEFLLR